ncbi:DUF881 domain-containing protein [Tumebacillus sp. DT12]|uniref:DUF881 domain-containing protein n=1 Tax=Tumebacillus lacus TaxID=2995335 RepID=A0ABT3X7I6_9BACL|nr:DUF881 domain-containing protein [Tumebacillus lacus]MCX7571611.1 DUF881 domain-containing protein [Tumebacillus lacus]
MPKKINARVKLTISLTMISVILGLMLSMQYKNTRAAANTQSQVTTTDPKAQYTADQLSRIKEQNKALEGDIEKLRKELYEFEKQATQAGNNVPPEVRDDLTKYKIMAGVLPVKGPGISFTVTDSIKDGQTTNLLITHDSDLRMMVNEMFIGGAEAIAINDQRITTTSGIICIGPIVMINGVKVSPPFEFKAVGQAQTMMATFELRGGVFDLLGDPGGRALSFSKPKMHPSLTLPAYAGDFNGLSE